MMVALLLLFVSLWILPGWEDDAFEAAPGAGAEVSAMDDGGPTPPKP